MQTRNIYHNLSPLDHRYYNSNRKLFDDLSRYFSEEAVVLSCVQAEAALLYTHIDIFWDGDETKKRDAAEGAEKVTPELVYEEEEKTHHNIRALVNVYQRFLPSDLAPYVHLGATSVDILDTAASMRTKEGVKKVVLPLLIKVEVLLCDLALHYKDTPQTGRTHGQHAVPITVGFAFAEYCARLGKSIIEINRCVGELRGKLAGAVGGYNGTSLLVEDPIALEERYLDYLNLKPSEYSNQIVEPEYLLRLLTEINTAFGIIANLADDLRNLQRSEIGEVIEFFSAEQVGSSTMPQKRNPWNSEHVKSLWKTFSPRVVTFFMDQISEHQRDLTNSASSRFAADYIAGFCAAAERMRKILSSIHVDEKRCLENLRKNSGSVLAEPVYILLASAGLYDGHEYVRAKTVEADEQGISLKEILQKDEKTWNILKEKLRKNYNIDIETFFKQPEQYRGKTVNKAQALGEKYKKVMADLSEELKNEN